MVPWIPVVYFESWLERLHQETPAGSTWEHHLTSMLLLLRLCPWAGSSSSRTFGSGVSWASSFLLSLQGNLYPVAPTCLPGFSHHQNQNHGLIIQWKKPPEPGQGQRGSLEKNSYWFLLFTASWQLSLTAPVEPTRPCTSGLAGAYGAWDSSLAYLPSGSKMQADILCRLPPKAAAQEKSQLSYKVNFKSAWL